MQHHHSQNYTIMTCYTCYCIQSWGWRNAPQLCFRKVLLVSSLLSGKAWQECAQQTEKSHSHTNSTVSRQVYVHALLVQHHSIGCIFSTYGLVWSCIRNRFNVEKAKNLFKIYRFHKAEEDNQYPVEFTVRIILLLFTSPSKFVAVRFVLLKTICS